MKLVRLLLSWLTPIPVTLAVLIFSGMAAQAKVGDVHIFADHGITGGTLPVASDAIEVSLCFGKRYGDAVASLESRNDSGVWKSHSGEVSEWYLDSSGCIENVLAPAQLARFQDASIDIRLTVKKQKIGKKLVDARSKSIGTFKTWNVNPKGDRSAAVPHLAAFAERYGGSVATIYCTDLNRGGVSQGTGFSVSANLSEDAKARAGGSTYLITAGHVVDDCFFEQHRNVSVLYRGQTYPGFVVSAFSDPDLGSVITSAPIPYAKLADTTSKKPGVGDIGVSVSSAGGVPGTVTQGQISGVSQKQLNSGIPAGQGSSGGPVFNNVGEVIGIVVARNVSLTELVAIPSFCGTVFLKEVCSITW